MRKAAAFLLAICSLIYNAESDNAWFGSRSQYKCHCTNAQCNTDGNCMSGSKCERGWFGPSCQYRDLAAGKKLVDLDTFTDGDDSTCRQIPSRYNVDLTLDNANVITWIRIVTQTQGREHAFTVTFQEGRDNSFEIQCEDPVESINHKTTDITCRNLQVVGGVRIQFKAITNLCSIYVSGGRNVALKQNATQSSNYGRYFADKAVDGNTDSNFERGQTCTHTIENKPGWWRMQFDHPKIIYQFILYNRDFSEFRLNGFTLRNFNANKQLISKYTEEKQWNKTIYYVSNINVSSPVYFVEVNVTDILTLCEVEIYGDCVRQQYGLDCIQSCSSNCKNSKCDPVAGNCWSCNDGFTGTDCLTQCVRGRYGEKCSKPCSRHCTGEDCDAVSGKCKTCLPGKIGDYCENECTMGTYGNNCRSTCSKNCTGQRCDADSGKCKACPPGKRGDYCDTVCAEKTYGLNCKETCSSYCLDSKCDPVNGRCLACRAGYLGADCRTGCPRGRYGNNCSSECSQNCANQLCYPENGRCVSCPYGQKGEFCEQKCVRGRYGENCSKSCSRNCTGEDCDAVSGKCKTCLPGKMGDYCENECTMGTYGNNCRSTCSKNCTGERCDTDSGKCKACPPGKIGNYCDTGCDARRHGQDCKETCSSSCLHQLCDHVTGDCNSCVEGKVGAKCTEDCPVKTYGLNCTNRCSDNCAIDGRCDPSNGTCLHGCVAGHQGDNCGHTCTEGYYGQNCTHSCSSLCLKQLCNHVTGDCHMSVEGKAESKCTDDQGHSAIKLKYIGTGVGIGVATSSFVFLLVITVVYFVKSVNCIGNKTTNNGSSKEKEENAEMINVKELKTESATTEQDSADVYHNEITNMYDVIG